LELVVLLGLLVTVVCREFVGLLVQRAVVALPVSVDLMELLALLDQTDPPVNQDSLEQRELLDCPDSRVCRAQLGLEALLEALGQRVLQEVLELLD